MLRRFGFMAAGCSAGSCYAGTHACYARHTNHKRIRHTPARLLAQLDAASFHSQILPRCNLSCAAGAVFEASLPPDLADMYRRLAVLLPQAPIPLVTALQLWGVTDPQEAQETVQIFVMQGVLKVATLPDGATWLMVSPEHQQYILVRCCWQLQMRQQQQ